VANSVFHYGSNGGNRLRGVHIMVEVRKKSSEDIGVRLLKLLLYRLYSMSYVIPLKWYEILISVVMGALTGIGIGSVIGGYVKHVVR